MCIHIYDYVHIYMYIQHVFKNMYIYIHIWYIWLSIPSCCFFALPVDIFESEDDANDLGDRNIFQQLLAFLDLSTLL